MHYDALRNQDPADYAGCTAVIDSIEKRWAKADQDVFIAAVVLNPFFKREPFSLESRLWSEATVLSLMKRLYKCFFSVTEEEGELEESINELYSNLGDYLDGSGICQDLAGYIEDMESQAQRANVSPDPLRVFRGITPDNRRPPPLFKLANHILSICPNSASCERLFSVFGNTLTKLRNRLGNQTLTSLAELKMHIRDEHMRNNETKMRMKRIFGAANTSSLVSPAAPPSAVSSLVSPAAAPAVNSLAQTSAPPQLPVIDPQLEDLSTPAQEACAPHQLTSAMEMDMEMDIDPGIPSASNNAANEFTHIVETFARLSNGDEDEQGAFSSSQLPISRLFDFSAVHWVSKHGRSASRSLNEELELYELLDMDAAGEEDVDLEIDPVLDSVLM